MSSLLKSESDRCCILWGLLVAIAAVYAVAYAAFPAFIDNWIFESFYLEGSGGSSDFSLDAWGRYIWREYQYDNARLAQVVAPLITLHLSVMKWPVAILLGICTAGITAFTTRLACGRLTAPALIAVWFLLTLFLPWRNWMVGILYASNYMIPCLFMLWAIYLMRSHSTFRLRYILPLLLLTVWGHESIGLSFACGMLGYIIMQRFTVDRHWWVATLFILAISLILVFGAGMVRRMGSQLSCDFSLAQLTRHIVAHYLLYVLITYYGYCLLSRRYRPTALSLVNDPVFVLCSASALTLAVVNMFNLCQSHFGFTPQITSFIAIGILFRYCHKSWHLSLPRLVYPAVFSCLLAFWSAIAYRQTLIYTEYRHMHNEIVAHKGGTVTMEFQYLDKTCPWLLNIPMRNLINNRYDIYCLSRRYPVIGNHDQVIIVHPDGSPYTHSALISDENK